MRAVFDTNVFISGIFWNGISAEVLGLWRSGKVSLVTSNEIISELSRILDNFKIRLSEPEKSRWIKMLVKNSLVVLPLFKVNVVLDDPTDNKFVEAAIAGKAEVIVTQDRHLLKIKEYSGIKIMTPQNFVREIKF